jgi:hypothetical protein
MIKISQESKAADQLLAVLFNLISCSAVFFKFIICTPQDYQLAKTSKSVFLNSMLYYNLKQQISC